MHIRKTTKKLMLKAITGAFLSAAMIFVAYFVWAKDIESEIDEKYEEVGIATETSSLNIHKIDISDEFIYSVNGTASYYADRFHGRLTANGERFNMHEPTAAHKKLPFGTILRITNRDNGNVTFVRINDRGPYIKGRILDLSYGSAKNINGLGLPKIKIEGLLHDDIPETADTSKKYYFGYSYSDNLVCLPETAIDIKDSARKFTNALRIYEEYNSINDNGNSYLFIRADKPQRRESRKSGFRYYIGTVRDREIDIPVIASEEPVRMQS